MCEFEQNRSNQSERNNQTILLNPSKLQNQLDQAVGKRKTHEKGSNSKENGNRNGKMAEEPLTLTDYLNAISKTFTERKLIQKVLPTKFSREFLGNNANEPITSSIFEDNGKYCSYQSLEYEVLPSKFKFCWLCNIDIIKKI